MVLMGFYRAQNGEGNNSKMDMLDKLLNDLS